MRQSIHFPFLIGVSLALGGQILATADSAPGTSIALTPDVINALAEEMRTNNPAVRAADARVTAAEAGVAGIRSWDDPTVMIGGQFAETAMRADEGDLLYGVEQRLPLFGKSGQRRNFAREEAEVERVAGRATFENLRRELVQSLVGAAYAFRVVEAGEEDLRWLEAAVATVEQRYRVGDLPQVYLLRLQNERSRRRQQLVTDRLGVLEATATLNRLLGRPVDSAWPHIELPPPAGAVLYDPRLVELAVANEPRLRVLRQQAQAADAAVAVSRRERYPEIALGAEGRNYTGNGDFRQAMVRLSVSLPWLNDGKYRHDIRRDTARRQAAEFDAADYELAVREEVRRLTVGLDAARREAFLYRDEILPRSIQALASAEASWAANRAMFLDVMDARRLLVEARLTHARAVADQYRLLADLVLCCGLGDLGALEMIGAQAQPAQSSPADPASPTPQTLP